MAHNRAVDAILISAAAIFIAEFGDKSQLLVLAFATRYPALPVIAGIVVAAAAIQGLSVAVGAALGVALPETALGLVAGAAFIGVAIWTLLGDDEAEDGPEASAVEGREGRSWLGVMVLVATTFVLGELGDKTMLATFALAARQDPIATWVGATAGMVVANLVAVVVGRGIGTRLRPRVIRIGSSALFALAGIVVIAGAVGIG